MAQENYVEGCSMQRPPLLEADGFCFWKACFETYVKFKDIDLWQWLHTVNAIVTSLKYVHPDYSSKNHVRKFLYAIPLKWRAKVTAIQEAKDLATLPLNELVGNLKVYEMILENDGVVSTTTTKQKVKSLALKAKVTREKTSDDSDNQGGSDEDVDEKEAEAFNLMAKNFHKLFRKGNRFGRGNRFGNGANRFRKGCGNSFGNKGGESSKQKGVCYNCGVECHFASGSRKPKENKAFVGGAWSDSEDGDEPQNDATCIMSIGFQEVCLKCDLLLYDWIVDSGCTKHMTRNRRLFTSYKAYDDAHVVFRSNLKDKVVSRGNITHDSITITNVEHVSGLAFNLINVGDENPIRTLGDYSKPSHEAIGIPSSSPRTIDQSASGKLRDLNAEESWLLLEDLALYDNESWNDPRDFAKPVKAIALPQDVPMNKITTSCEICSGPHDTQYCMEDPEQAFVEYASSRTDEAGGGDNPKTLKNNFSNPPNRFQPNGSIPNRSFNNHPQSFNNQSSLEGLVSNFMASQDARLSKFKADFKRQQGEMTNKINTELMAITDRIMGTLPSDTVKNLKLSTSPVLSAHSYPKIDPQCSSHPSNSIKAIEAHFKETTISQTSLRPLEIETEPPQPKEPELTLKDEFQDLHLNLPVLEVLAHAPIYITILDKYVESLELGKNGSAFIQG
ncbi:MAK10-like protein [Tanacetum coccineum]